MMVPVEFPPPRKQWPGFTGEATRVGKAPRCAACPRVDVSTNNRVGTAPGRSTRGLGPPYIVCAPELVAPAPVWQGWGAIHDARRRPPGAAQPRWPMNDPQLAARRITLWLIALALTAAFCAVSVAWFDRPIAFFVHRELGQPLLLTQLPRISEWLGVAGSCVVVA